MIARHSNEQSDSGEGVEVIVNSPCEHPEHGKGQYTEKRIHLSRFVAFYCDIILKIPKAMLYNLFVLFLVLKNNIVANNTFKWF